MPSIVLLLTFLLCFDFVPLTAHRLDVPHQDTLIRGYICGSEVYRESYITKRLSEESKKPKIRYHGLIDFGSDVLFKVPILAPATNVATKMPRYPTYVIVDSTQKLIGVISPRAVDINVDNIDKSILEPGDYRFPETSLIYRKCLESPTINSISSPVGGFQCEEKVLRTQDAIKAATWARKMHTQGMRNFQTSENINISPVSYPEFPRFKTVLAEYVVPIKTNGEFDTEGSIAIALDQDFNIIGAVSRKKRKILKCTLIKKVPPKLIGPDLETRPKGYDEYECAFGYVTTSHVLKQASSVAMADFKEKEKNPILQYPAVYFGLLFPEISDTLYYIPHVSEAGKTAPPVVIVLTRSCDVAGVMQITPDGFLRCSRTTTTNRRIQLSSNRNYQDASFVKNQRN